MKARPTATKTAMRPPCGDPTHPGDVFTAGNVRSIRPAHGLHTRHLGEILGRRAARDIERGTPLSWDLVSA